MHMLITSLQVPICFVSILDFLGEKKTCFKHVPFGVRVFFDGGFSSLQSTGPT